MQRQSVNSSNIAAIGHDAETNTLEVEFKNGGVFAYSGVDQSQYAELLNAESVGKHFHSHIRGKCDCRRVGGEE